MHSLPDPFTGKKVMIFLWKSPTDNIGVCLLHTQHQESLVNPDPIFAVECRKISMCSYVNILIVCFREDSLGKNVEVSPADISSRFSEEGLDGEIKSFLYKSILKLYSIYSMPVP